MHSVLRRHRPFLVWLALLALLGVVQASCSPNDPQNTLAAQGEVARKQQDLYWMMFYWAAGVFVVVEGLLVFTAIWFRRRPGQAIPAQVHGNTPIEIAWTIAPTLILISIAIPTIATIFDNARTPDVSMHVRVIGHQWWWEYQYPEIGVITASELHIPAGEPIDLSIESADVPHSFWVPKLAGKMDALPSRINKLWIKADGPGTLLGECVELCGVQHANMRLKVVVQSRADFEKWVQGQKALPAPGSGDVARGAQVFATNACIGCHTIQGTPGVGRIGPNLTHVGGRTTLAGASIENTTDNMKRWLKDPQAVKPGTLMPNLNLSDDQVSALAAYLESLK